MNISIKTIPQKEQRYATIGDYYEENGVLNFRISELGNKDYEFLVRIHEEIEQYLCEKRGITNKMIDDYDMSEFGLSIEDPGSHPKAPYHKEHMLALKVEKLLYKELDVNVDEFEDKMGVVIETYDAKLQK